jgi:murein DD-endopeptidase MepM/ murein hydrolase activator NlpD
MRMSEGKRLPGKAQFGLRPLVFAAAIVALLFTLVPPTDAAPRPRKPKKSARQIKHDLRSVRVKIKEKRQQIRANKKREHKVTAEIVAVEHRLLKTESRLRRSRSRLESLGEQQGILKQRIDATEKRLQGRRRLLAMRLRSNYERGSSGYMSVLLGSRSLHDYMSRSYYVGRIVDNDVKLLEGIKLDRQQLAGDKRELDARERETRHVARLLVDDQAQFSEDHRDKEGLLHQLRRNRQVMVEALDEMERASNTLEADLRALAQTARGRARMLRPWTGSFIKPASGPVTSRFGSRYHPVLHRTRMHTGVDIGAGHGSAIRAAGAGEVIFAGYRNGYGNTVLVDHGGGTVTLYAHCSSIGVSVGQSVRQGQTIARVGSTGLATGPHLHFEVRRNGTPVNPQ